VVIWDEWEDEMIQYVVGFLFDPKLKRVILIRKTHPAWQDGLLNGVGGKVWANESYQQAMSREFLEEVGIEIPPAMWTHKLTLVNYQKGYLVAVLSTTSHKAYKPHQVTDEEPGVWPLEHIYSRPKGLETVSNLPWMIGLCLDQDLRFPITIEDIGDN